MPILLPVFDDAAQVLDRMKAFMEKPLSVEFTLTRSDTPLKATGKLIMQRPRQMRFWVKFAGEDFESAATPSGIVDLSRNRKVFMETGPLNQLFAPNSHYTPVPEATFPGILLQGDVRKYMPAAGKGTLAGKATVGGVVCDHVKNPNYDAYIAEDGRLMKFRYTIETQSTKIDMSTEFTNYVSGKRFPDSTFVLEPPAGFRPFALTRETLTFPIGTTFPQDDWLVDGQKVDSLEKGKAFLALVTTGDCEISGRAQKALSSLASVLPVWVLTDDKMPAGLSGFKMAIEPGRSVFDRMYIPVTPFIYFVDKDGKIQKLWMGFDSEKEDQFVKDVKALAGKS